MGKKYFWIILTIIDLGLSITLAQSAKVTAPLDNLNQENVEGSFSYNEIGTGENFNDEKIFEKAEGTFEYTIPDLNLPKIRTQDGTPLCQAFCPTVLAQFKYCKQAEIENCRDLPDSKRLSPLSMLAYRDNVNNPIKASMGSISSTGKRKTHEVMNSVSTASPQYFFTEGCAPFDQIAKKFDNDPNAIEAFRSILQSKFDRIKEKLKETEASESSCPECIELMNLINEGFFSKTNFYGFAKAIKKMEFNNFLFTFLFSQQALSNKDVCNRIKLEKKIRANSFPTEPNTSLENVFAQATEQLKKKNPVLLTHLCFTKSKTNGKCSAHCLVLTGEKTVRNKITGEIVHLIKVHNSWDKKWQKDHSDGWVRADKLKSIVPTADDETLRDAPKDRKNSFGYTISWFDED